MLSAGSVLASGDRAGRPSCPVAGKTGVSPWETGRGQQQ